MAQLRRHKVSLEQHPFRLLGLAGLFGTVGILIQWAFVDTTLPSHGQELLAQGILVIAAACCGFTAVAAVTWFLILMAWPSSRR